MKVKTVRLAKWADLPRFEKDHWIYRGQAVASWQLRRSLERAADQQGIQARDRVEFEDRLFREFRRAYHQYTDHIPRRQDVVEWLSVMQHHGAPTRMLDFTYSIWVAAYFAIEHASRDSAVWAIDSHWALNRSAEVLRAAGKPNVDEMLEPFVEGDERLVRPLFFERPFVLAAWPITPFRLSQRLRIQQGTFLIPGDVSRSFMDNLRGLRDLAGDHVIKIVLPAALRSAALKALFAMNISRAGLFPGLDGYSQALGVYHPAQKKSVWRENTGTRSNIRLQPSALDETAKRRG